MYPVTDIVPFTGNFQDQSNEDGYQFEFFCERCDNGYRSPFQESLANKGRGLLRAAGGLFGGAIGSLSDAADDIMDRGTNSAAKDKALREAVAAVKPHFRQCRGCGDWVCQEVCWNDAIGQCVMCSPLVAEELSKLQAEAQLEQLREKVRETDWTEDLDVTTRVKVTCPSCGAASSGGKFCGECGGKMSPATFCTECGAKIEGGARFCSECGTPATP
jgi:hypothetical protein